MDTVAVFVPQLFAIQFGRTWNHINKVIMSLILNSSPKKLNLQVVGAYLLKTNPEDVDLWNVTEKNRSTTYGLDEVLLSWVMYLLKDHSVFLPASNGRSSQQMRARSIRIEKWGELPYLQASVVT